MSDSPVTNDSQAAFNASTASSAENATTAGARHPLPDRPWFRFYEQGVLPHLEIPDHPLTWMLDQTAKRYPDHTAILYYGKKYTYAHLATLADRFAAGLQQLGVRKSDRVAIALPNIPQYPVAFYGTLKAGAVVVQTNPLYTQREMQHQLADAEARYMVMLEDFEAVSHGKVVEGYGLSETSPVTHCNPLNENCRNGTIGLPLANIDAAILDQKTGEMLPVGEIGELVVKGPNIMKGYWKHAEATQASFSQGWLLTGDLAKMDADGYFSIVDRAKDMIDASGFKVFPREVEEVLFNHPAVQEASVVGVPDAYRGETVAAFIVLKPGFEASEKMREAIWAYCKQNLAPYKVPTIVEFRESLPKSLLGKVLRRELKGTKRKSA